MLFESRLEEHYATIVEIRFGFRAGDLGHHGSDRTGNHALLCVTLDTRLA